MQEEDELRQQLLSELEDAEWDLSEDILEKIANKFSPYFSSVDDARDFVEENASSLYKSIEEFYES